MNKYAEIIGHKKIDELIKEGGTEGILQELNVKGLQDSRRRLGIATNTIRQRQVQYGSNTLPPPPRETIWYFLIESIKEDKVIQILIGAALLSIILGMTTPDYRTGEVDIETGWIEGFAIFVSVFIVTGINAINDYKKQEQFAKVSQTEDESRRGVIVWRYDGEEYRTLEISNADLVVGDVIQVSAGMQLTFDALLVTSYGPVIMDESSATGENDEIYKNPLAWSDSGNVSADCDPFLISGSCVLDGSAEGTAVICAVGEHSFAGEIAIAIQNESKKDTPLQEMLAELADNIGKLGVAAAVLTFVSLLLKELIMAFFMGSKIYAMKFFENLTTAIAIVVVAVPEGLPLSVTVSLAYSMRRMLQDGNLVRHLAACETMGGATILCVDKTGTLTLPNMRLRQLYTGRTSYPLVSNPSSSSSGVVGSDAAVELSLPTAAVQLLLDCVVANAIDPESGRAKNKTGEALVELCARVVTPQASFTHTRDRILQTLRDTNSAVRFPFSSQSKQSVTLVRIPGDSTGGKTVIRQFISGAAETILAKSVSYLSESGSVEFFTPEARFYYEEALTNYSTQGLRTVCCAYVDLYPPHQPYGDGAVSECGMPHSPVEEGFCLLGVIGVEESIRPEVPGAVSACMGAGIRVMMITGDAALTAINIAQRCGILSQGGDHDDAVVTFDNPPSAPPSSDWMARGYVLEGPTFRALSNQELLSRYIPHLRVLSRATPLDKKRMVTLLKEYDPQAVVAMTGDGTNDAPALKMSDVGFAMNAGSDVAKQSSDIILLNNSFIGMVKATVWGRNVKDNIRKFLQFQLTVNLAACVVAFVGAIMSSQNISPLKPVQLLWLNLIMDTLAALALATELPCEKVLLSRPPERKDTPIITPRMWFMVTVQSSFQLLTQMILLRYGHRIFPAKGGSAAAVAPASPESPSVADHTASMKYFGEEHLCIVFNVFVWLQVFNFLNARLLHDNEHFLDNWKHSKILLLIVCLIAGLQIFIVQCGGKFMSTVPLSFSQWVLSVAMGSCSLAVGAVSRWYLRRGNRSIGFPAVYHLLARLLPKSRH